MDLNVQSLRPDTPISEAVTFFLHRQVTGAPVVNETNEVVGLLSEKDCLRLLAIGDNFQPPSGVVGDFMTTTIKIIPSNMNIYFVAGMFLNDVVRRFPVVDNGKLVEVITRFDILRAIQTELFSQ